MNSLLLGIGFVMMLILVVLFINLLLRVRDMEKMLLNFTPTEAYTIMENMREMVIESGRVSDNLDEAIKLREAALEDLSVLVDEKIARLYNILEANPQERGMKQRIFDMYSSGKTASEIASELRISVTEVRLAISMASGR